MYGFNTINFTNMNELINLMYQIKDLSTRTNEIALIDLQPRLMAIYDKLQIEQLSICDVSNTEGKLQAVEDLKDLCYDVCPLDRRDDLSEIVDRL
jgi:hypothetical protein